MNRKQKKPLEQTIRCAIYTRKSTEEGLEQEFNSLDAQRASGEAYIASQKHEGWVCLPEVYDDGGFSGGSMVRPALKRLMDDIAAGKIDCVVVYKVDRLSRSLLDFTRIMETFDKHGVSFVSVTQQFNTTHSMGRLTLNILLSFAQFEREIIGERIRDKIAAQRRRGKWAGGVPVLGYDVDRSGASPKLMVNAEEAARVRQIFNLYLEYKSLMPVVSDLARRKWLNKTWLTKKGVTRGGRAFDRCSLYDLLTNPIYVGRVKHKSEVFAGEHERLISPTIFEKVQAILRKHGAGGGRHLINKYNALLKGLLRCHACDKAMVHTFTHKGNKRYRYYVCSQQIKNGRKACPSESLPAAEIEAAVVSRIRCISRDEGLRDDVLRLVYAEADAGLAELNLQKTQVMQQLARDHGEINRLAVAARPTSATSQRMAELIERITKAEVELGRIDLQIEEVKRHQVDRASLSAAFEDFDNIWGSLKPHEQINLLSLLVCQVEYDPKSSSIAISFHPAAIVELTENNHGDAA